MRSYSSSHLPDRPDTSSRCPSDLAQHYLVKANVSALRRVRKSDNNRIALAVGATIVNRVEDLRESDVGTECKLFNIEKIGDELRSFPFPLSTLGLIVFIEQL